MGLTTRESALCFTEGVRTGWLASDLATWVDDHLIRTERLALEDPSRYRINERGIGSFILTTDDRSIPPESPRSTNADIARLVAVSRQLVLDSLRSVIESGECSFANAALYAGLVRRERDEGGQPVWRVHLTTDIALSDQVLALFAADALETMQDYEHELAVCDVCGAVRIGLVRGSRRGCVTHPFGLSDQPRSTRSQGSFRPGRQTGT